MERSSGKHLVLILARELASNIATPMLIVDADRVIVFFNEPAERLLGETFSSVGERPVGEWGREHKPERLDGSPYPLDDFPLTVALRAQKPAHDSFAFLAGDGTMRNVSAAAYPLFAQSDDFVGAVAIFWENGET